MSVVLTVDDVAIRVDRAVLTIKRWEKRKLIPYARRDSRGWRVYSQADVEHIVNLVQATNYFMNKN